MIRITQLKLPIDHGEKELREKAARALRIRPEEIRRIEIVRRSVDARKKEQIHFIYTVDVETARETAVLKRAGNPQAAPAEETAYRFLVSGETKLPHPPVIVGSGPAGLFAGYLLARAGFRPVILERGADVDERRRRVERFWKDNILDERTNVQFGEGGAGTFSDGKLNTMVKDPEGRGREVLRILAEHGADPSILYDAKPHIGTDVLGAVVKNLREHIRSLGGTVMFGAQVTDLLIENGRVRGVKVSLCGQAHSETPAGGARRAAAVGAGRDEAGPAAVIGDGRNEAGLAAVGAGRDKPGPAAVIGDGRDETGSAAERVRDEIVIPAEAVILAVGHSARDTFSMLLGRGVPMQQKAFAVGLRIQHPQRMINESQYGIADVRILGPASYKLTCQTGTGRGVYSFCMCPGGFVVNASSERGRLAVNGMSNHDRGGENANSALIVTVTPEDFGSSFPLAGAEYQRRLEEAAYAAGCGKIPVQLYGDFRENRVSRDWGDVAPQFKGGTEFANLREVLPGYLSEALLEGMVCFEQKIRGFSRYDSILAGIESRTSSPVRIPRNERYESAVAGLFPCGEGAGYAGGITSAAMDGMKAAEELGRRYRP